MPVINAFFINSLGRERGEWADFCPRSSHYVSAEWMPGLMCDTISGGGSLARIRHLYISPSHNYFGRHGLPPGDAPMVEMDRIECVAGRGIRDDRFFDFKKDYKGQITFFSAEVYERLLAEFHLSATAKPPGVLRRNVIVSGVDLNEWIGAPFEIGGVRFEGTGECSPCRWMDEAVCPGAERWLKGAGGLRARILTDGILEPQL